MKTKIMTTDGKEGREIELPKFFSSRIREDIVSRILEAKKSKQPYSPSPTAGKQSSASGRIVHTRKVWMSGYGRGMSRVPRRIVSRRGSQFNWIGAEVSSTRGGRRAHPPKSISMINTSRVNKKELTQALISALSATANKKEVSQRYLSISEKELSNLPVIVESKITSLKTKEIIDSLKKILGENLFSKVSRKRKIRAGKGKLRGRKHKTTAGLLLVTGSDEKVKTTVVETKNAKKVGVVDLAGGGLGRLTIYTESAIKELGERIK